MPTLASERSLMDENNRMHSSARIALQQSDFSINYILNQAGNKTELRAKCSRDVENGDSEIYNCFSDSSSCDEIDQKREMINTHFLNSCAPSFDWLYYTRYRPPKLPRPIKVGPTKRTPGRLPRVPFTSHQLQALEDAYKLSSYLSSDDANRIADDLDLTHTRVKIWFQNRRARERRECKLLIDNKAFNCTK